jgi:hypothetical protein
VVRLGGRLLGTGDCGDEGALLCGLPLLPEALGVPRGACVLGTAELAAPGCWLWLLSSGPNAAQAQTPAATTAQTTNGTSALGSQLLDDSAGPAGDAGGTTGALGAEDAARP